MSDYYIGEVIPLGRCSHSGKKGKVICKEITRAPDGSESTVGLYLKLRDGKVKLYKLAKWEKGSFLGHDSLGDLLLASGYVVSKGPQLIPGDRIIQVDPMPKSIASQFIKDYIARNSKPT